MTTEQSKPNTHEKKEEKMEEKQIQEEKKEEKVHEKNEPKKEHKPKVKKEEAVAVGKGLHSSLKHAMYICNFIKGKPIDQAISELEEVIQMRRIVPFKGEIPHRKGKGIMSGRYPVASAKLFVPILKGLKGNAIVNGLDLEKTVIYYGNPSWAYRPAKSGGKKGKRIFLMLKAREVTGEKKNG